MSFSFLKPFLYELFQRPFLNGIIFFYTALPFHDLGISIVLLTITVRLLLFPATLKMLKSQAAMRVLQPKIKEIQDQFKGNKEEQSKRLMALYGEHGVNPFSGCLPLLIQLPVLIGLYRIFWNGINPSQFNALYSFIAAPAVFSSVAFGVVDLSLRSIPLALTAGVSQFFQARLAAANNPSPAGSSGAGPDMTRILSLQTTYFFPGLIAIWSFSLPAALPLYWTTMNVLAIVEQILIQKRYGKRQ